MAASLAPINEIVRFKSLVFGAPISRKAKDRDYDLKDCEGEEEGHAEVFG